MRSKLSFKSYKKDITKEIPKLKLLNKRDYVIYIDMEEKEYFQ